MYLRKVIAIKLGKNLFFVDILKATKEKSKIRIRKPVARIRIRTKTSRMQNTDKYFLLWQLTVIHRPLGNQYVQFCTLGMTKLNLYFHQFTDHFSNFIKHLAYAARYLFFCGSESEFRFICLANFLYEVMPILPSGKPYTTAFFQLLAFRQPSARCGKTDPGL